MLDHCAFAGGARKVSGKCYGNVVKCQGSAESCQGSIRKRERSVPPPPPCASTSLSKHGDPSNRFPGFSDRGFCGQKCNVTPLCSDCRGQRGLDHACSSSSCNYNPMLLVCNVADAGMAVTYIRSTGELVPSTIIDPSTRGDGFCHMKYICNGHQIEHHASFDRVISPICSPSPAPSETSPTRGRPS